MAERDVVVGGGLAGLTAALDLADAGHDVTLVEARPRLGGRACSFTRNGLQVDNGQHVFLRCCTAYRGLLDRLGAAGRTVLQPRLDVPVLTASARGRLRRTPGLPPPLHLAWSLAGYGPLPLPDRVRAARALLALRHVDPNDPAADARSFGEFLRTHGQSTAAVAGLWALIGTATLNAAPDDASLALAAKVFRTAFLERSDAADVGHAGAPLGVLHHDAARGALERAGVEILLRQRATHVRQGLVTTEGRAGGRDLPADGVVLAVPPGAVPDGLPKVALGSSPIVNVHLHYDRRVTDLPFAAAVGSPVQWFFDRTVSSGAADGQYLAITVSAAGNLLRRPSRAVIGEFATAMEQLLPPAGRAGLRDAFVTREPHATFRQSPGSAAARPGPATAVPGVALAGAWTATGWPDTMESAVRSGHAAADHLLGSHSVARPAAAVAR